MESSFEDAYNRLSVLKKQGDAAQQCMKNFNSDAGSFVTNAALKYFSALNDMEADDIRKFGSIISQHLRNLTEDLDRLNYKVKKGIG